MKLLIINGPNLNMLGIREKEIYGEETFASLEKKIQDYANEKGIEVTLKQSNHEGDLVDWIQEAYFSKYDGVIINPGAYTHTSIALKDAVKAIQPIPVVEVHLSDVEKREDFRQVSYIREDCIETITGLGTDGYIKAIDVLINR